MCCRERCGAPPHSAPWERVDSARSKILAGLEAVFRGWLFFGVQDTLTAFVEGDDFAAHYLMETGWGLLFLVLVATPLVGLVVQPRSAVLAVEVAAVGVAVAAGAVLARSAAHLIPAVGLLGTALVVTALGRLAVLSLLAADPAFAYAWRMATGPHDVERTVNLNHNPIQAALGISIVLVSALVAVAADWLRGVAMRGKLRRPQDRQRPSATLPV